MTPPDASPDFGITAKRMTTDSIQDVTDQARTLISDHVVKAEQKGNNVLMLIKLDQANNITFDRRERQCRFQLHYRWLSDPASLTSVQGSENTYWGRRAVSKCLRKRNPAMLFETFQLF